MASQSDAAANNDGERRRVLVVDDAPTIAEVVSRYLERAGYDTRQAHTGPGAFSSAHSAANSTSVPTSIAIHWSLPVHGYTLCGACHRCVLPSDAEA